MDKYRSNTEYTTELVTAMDGTTMINVLDPSGMITSVLTTEQFADQFTLIPAS